ncbi:hypothetical protein BDR05DRAFT_951815 [Suillus weaverae]|nr:hypothetical protein BDR05DRAFT_951815 [Suillus weaverae]
MKEVAKVIDKDGTHWLPVAPTPQATLLKKIRSTIDSGDETDIDSLTKQLATLEDDPKAITKDGFDVGDAIGKALALIEQIHKSPQARTFLKKSCEEEGISVHKILAWEPTTVQQSFSSATHPTASQTIPTLECLADTWQTMANSTEYLPVADAIQKGLRNVGKYYEKTNNSDIDFICLVLDPNYKLVYVESHWSVAKVTSGRVCLQALFNKYYKVPPMSHTMEHAAVPTKVLQGVWYSKSWMHNAVTARQAADNHTHDPLQELSSYLTSLLEETDNIVAWWGGSAVPSECAFSNRGITSTLHHNALAPATFSTLQLLKASYHNGHVSAATEAEEFAAMLD